MTLAGYKFQLRRSSRLRQNSLPKTTSTDPIDIIDSDNEESMLKRMKARSRRPPDNYYV